MADNQTPPTAAQEIAPSPPELAPALAHFEAGDFLTTRRELLKLLETKPAPDVESAAKDLLARMAPDPVAVRVGLGALALLVLVTVAYVF